MSRFRPAALCLWLLGAGPAAAQTSPGSPAPAPTPVDAEGRIVLTLKDHRFDPAEIRVAAGRPIEILLRNEDATADEFDSTGLRVEKVVGGGREGVIRIAPLAAGRYGFMGEFHADTAQGVVVAE